MSEPSMEKKTVTGPSSPVAKDDKSECALLASITNRAVANDCPSISASVSVLVGVTLHRLGKRSEHERSKTDVDCDECEGEASK